MMMNKKGQALVAVGIVVGAILLVALIYAGMYNGLVSRDVAVIEAWGNVQTKYQRRADLIPNLVETVKGARDFEQTTQTEIARLRSEAGQLKQDAALAHSPEQLTELSNGMDSVLSRLLVIVEAYPDLKANENFLSLQDELAGTENRITYARDEYNEAVKSYMVATRSFPKNLIANSHGFDTDEYDMFQAAPGSEDAPEVDFD